MCSGFLDFRVNLELDLVQFKTNNILHVKKSEVLCMTHYTSLFSHEEQYKKNKEDILGKTTSLNNRSRLDLGEL